MLIKSLHFRKPYRLTLLFSLVLLACAHTRPRTYAPISDFLITLSRTPEGIELTCTEGCAWTKLTFTTDIVRNGQLVDQNGMASATRAAPKSERGTNFLFAVLRTREQVQLQGHSGVAWTKLSFTCRPGCAQAIDEFGMTGGR